MVVVVVGLLFSVSSALTRIACLGDSITKGTGSSGDENGWPKRLQSSLGSDYEVLNFGRGGRTMVDFEGRFYQDTDEWDDALDSKADIVTISLGTNDAKVPEIWPEILDVEELYVETFKEMIETVRDEISDVKVYVLIPVPQLAVDDDWEDPSIINDRLPALVAQVAEETGAGLIDLRNGFDVGCCEETFANPTLFDDNIHPNDAGYTVIAGTVMDGLGFTAMPTAAPTYAPTYTPTTASPTTARPSSKPTTSGPTYEPSFRPTSTPSSAPSYIPTSAPTGCPSYVPSSMPTSQPSTPSPTTFPTSVPSARPTPLPTTPAPSYAPSTPAPSEEARPSPEPSLSPKPTTPGPSSCPSPEPTLQPTGYLVVAIAASLTVLIEEEDDFNADPANAQAFEAALVSAVDSVVDCTNAVAATSRRRRLQAAVEIAFDLDVGIFAANYDDARGVATQTAQEDLANALDDGTLDAAIADSAQAFGAPGLFNATVVGIGETSVSGVNTAVPSAAPSSPSSSSSSSTSSSDSAGMLAGIIVSVVVVVLAVVLAVVFKRSRRRKQSVGELKERFSETEVQRSLSRRSWRRHRPDASGEPSGDGEDPSVDVLWCSWPSRKATSTVRETPANDKYDPLPKDSPSVSKKVPDDVVPDELNDGARSIIEEQKTAPQSENGTKESHILFLD